MMLTNNSQEVAAFIDGTNNDNYMGPSPFHSDDPLLLKKFEGSEVEASELPVLDLTNNPNVDKDLRALMSESFPLVRTPIYLIH